MTVSDLPSSIAERRLAIARRLHQALVARHPNWEITLCDGSGEVVAQHRPEADAPKIAELGRKSPDAPISSRAG
jgi:hypothetical protein